MFKPYFASACIYIIQKLKKDALCGGGVRGKSEIEEFGGGKQSGTARLLLLYEGRACS